MKFFLFLLFLSVVFAAPVKNDEFDLNEFNLDLIQKPDLQPLGQLIPPTTGEIAKELVDVAVRLGKKFAHELVERGIKIRKELLDAAVKVLNFVIDATEIIKVALVLFLVSLRLSVEIAQAIVQVTIEELGEFWKQVQEKLQGSREDLDAFLREMLKELLETLKELDGSNRMIKSVAYKEDEIY